MLSCTDIRDAFHSMRLSKKAKDLCGIMPYFGSPHYRYERMPMGLCISPCKWIEYINIVMEGLPDKSKYIAIMDDILIHSKKKSHSERIEDLLKAIIRHGLKLSPKKCQFFRTELVYMGNVFKIKGKRFTISPIKTRIDAILNTPTPKTPKECKSFCGVVNYLSLFCPNLQSHLAPIYDLTRKGRPFVWTEYHQKAFETIKSLMCKPPLLHLPDGSGRYILCSDTSKTHAGSALWQIQAGRPRLLGYASKKLPGACKNYSITELEMVGMLYNLNLWKWYVLGIDVDVCVDHRAIPFIMKSKDLPTTDRIKRLLDELKKFTFQTYYMKGKDMILSDFLSRTDCDPDDPEELIPIAFNTLEYMEPVNFNPGDILESWSRCDTDEYSVMTRARSASSGVHVPPVHGAVKAVNPNLKPETQAKRAAAATTPKRVHFQTPVIKTPLSNVRGTSEVHSSVKDRVNTPILKTPSSVVSKPQSQSLTPQFNTPNLPYQQNTGLINTANIKKTLFMTPPQQSPQVAVTPQSPWEATVKHESVPQRTHVTGENTQLYTPHVQGGQGRIAQIPTLVPSTDFPLPPVDLEEIKLDPSLDPEGDPKEASIEAVFRPPKLKDFELPPTLGQVISNQHIFAKRMPKQVEIDKLMKQLNRKILRNTRMPTSLKDIAASYLQSAAFKDIYQYLRFDKLPTNKREAYRVESLSKDYFILGGLLFKHNIAKGVQNDALLCIPPSKIDYILDIFHGSLLGGHQGVTKTLKTLSNRFYCPRLADHVRAYVVGCHTCQLFKHEKRFNRPFQKRYYDENTPALTVMSMDCKVMPESRTGMKYILLLICEVSNFIVTHAMSQARAENIVKGISDEFISYFGVPTKIISDQDPAFLSSLMAYAMQQYGIQLITCSPTNHKSLQAEHGIKSLSNILVKNLSGIGDDWDIYCKPCMLTYNTATSPNLDDNSPFEICLGRKARLCPKLDNLPSIPVTKTFTQAKEDLDKKLKMFRKDLIEFRDKRHEMLNKDKEYRGFTAGQIVYLYFPGNSILQTNSKKITCQFVGPLVIWKCFSPTQFVLMSLDGIVYPFLVEETRLKSGHIHTSAGLASTLPALKKIIRSGYIITDANPNYNVYGESTIDEGMEFNIFIYSPHMLFHLDPNLELTPVDEW